MIYLPAHTAVMARPGVGIQFGVLPAHARILPLPPKVNTGIVMALFHQARSPMEQDTLVTRLVGCGLGRTVASDMVEELVRAGILRAAYTGSAEINLLSTGVAEELLRAELTRRHIPSRTITSARDAHRRLAVLPGMVFPPANIQQGLMERQAVHYPTGVVDGMLVCGPLIVPGHTPCLACVDHGYYLTDDGWRGIRMQAAARPLAEDMPLVRALGVVTAGLVAEHLLPWWNSGPRFDAIPGILAERRVMDLSGGVVHRHKAVADSRCYSCHSVRVLYA